jgi:DnaJ-class molecular chaperone
MTHKDYYKILGLSVNASADEIKKEYRKLAMQYHPDRNHGKEEWANEKFKKINEAFSVLGDPEKRSLYDQFGTVGNISDIFGSQATRTTFEDVMQDFEGAGLGFGFLDDTFGDLLKDKGFSFQRFGRGFGGTRNMRFETQGSFNLEDLFQQAQPRPYNSVKYEITLTNEQATEGIDKDLIRKGKKIRVEIPAGVKPGNKVRLRNALKTTDGQPGDIIINIQVK